MADWTQKLKLHHLQMLVALGEQGNLTQVAKMMNITQPALSKWLSQFEDEVGMVLFERHSKGLRPTEGGKLLLQHAQRLINDMSRSQYEIERFKQGGQVGSLMIGCSPVATDCVSQAILELLKEMPTLHLNIEEKVMTPLLNDLLAGVVDVVSHQPPDSAAGTGAGAAAELPGALHRTGLLCRPSRSPAGPKIAVKLGRSLPLALDRLAHRHANSPEHRQRAGG